MTNKMRLAPYDNSPGISGDTQYNFLREFILLKLPEFDVS